jgi:ssDNA-binding Zn-finger/Zn-ribbon topoisomerase 1
MVLKSGRFGEFTACSSYPTCKYVKQKTIGVKCPECTEGEVVERRSKRGKTFSAAIVSRLRLRGLGQAGRGEVSRMRQLLHDREMAQAGRRPAMPESGVQIQKDLPAAPEVAIAQ